MQFKQPQLKPIDREIFNKLIFCEDVFRFLNLEETLYFTKLDVELNSLKGVDLDEKGLLEINQKVLSHTFTCNSVGVKSAGKGQASPKDEEIKKMVEDHL
jgi:hypothetical protein